MLVEITSKDFSVNPQPIHITFDTYVAQMGLKYVVDTVYRVIDKQKFFLAIIKHGLNYKILSSYEKI